jgi:hypothetical protein
MKTMITCAVGCTILAAAAQPAPPGGGTPGTASIAPACERSPNAPQWLPCGPDRILNESDLKTYVVKDGLVTKMLITGGTSGKAYFVNFHPDGKLESGYKGAADIGKSWTLNGGNICRTYYTVYRGPQCGPFELKGGTLYLVDPDQVRSAVTAVEFIKK